MLVWFYRFPHTLGVWKGLRLVIVALPGLFSYLFLHGHDRNSSVNKYLAQEEPHVKNANDTWHATKGIAKVLKSVISGAKKNSGITWHEELSDKAASIKTAAFYVMKNCNGDPARLRELLHNIPGHYQADHSKFLPESRCKTEVVNALLKILWQFGC